LQTSWTIDASGNDENEGTALAPLRTFLEYRRRILGTDLDPEGVAISFTSDQAVDDEVILDFYPGPGGLTIAASGFASTVASGSFTTVTTRVAATNQQWEVADSVNVPDWSPYIGAGQRLNVTSGAAVGGYAFVMAALAGPARARVTTWKGGSVPAVTDTYDVVLERTLQRVRLTAPSGGKGGLGVVNFTIQDFNIVEVVGSGSNVFFQGCWIGSVDLLESYSITVLECGLDGFDVTGSGWILLQRVGLFFFEVYGTDLLQLQDVYVQDDRLDLEQGSYAIATELAVFDSGTSGVVLSSFSRMDLTSSVYGSGNSDFGWRMDTTCKASYAAAATLAATGTSGDVRVGTTTLGWAGLPFVEPGTSEASFIVKTT
jgi:hypothetical protein